MTPYEKRRNFKKINKEINFNQMLLLQFCLTRTTGAKRREKIYFSINDIADPNLAFSRLFGHEKAHMNTYDEGKDGEETSIHTREKIGRGKQE